MLLWATIDSEGKPLYKSLKGQYWEYYSNGGVIPMSEAKNIAEVTGGETGGKVIIPLT